MNKQTQAREIKFRAWFPQEKKMRDIDLGEQVHDVTEWFIAERDGKIMQYTGLKDKNGVEIYEGDVVAMFSGSQVSEVFWSEVGMWNVNAQVSGGSLLQEQLLGNLHDVCEIIGNIYENPSLLSPSK